MALDDPNQPKVLMELVTEIEARLLVGFLENEGISAFVVNSGDGTSWAGAGGNSHVLVRAKDFDAARWALLEYLDQEVEDDESDDQ